MRRFAVAALCLSVGVQGMVTSGTPAEPQAYLAACAAAQAHAASPAPWIANDLLTLQAGTPGLEWEGPPGVSKILVSAFTQSQFYNLSDRQTVTHPALWVVAGGELRDFYASEGVTADQIALRTKQLLGLPTAAAYDAIVEVYVNTADIFRPCMDPSITTGPCDTVWAGSMFTPVDPEAGGYRIEVTEGASIRGGQGLYASSANADIWNDGRISGPTGKKYNLAGTENISILFEHGGRIGNAGEITGNAVAIASRGQVGDGVQILNAGLLEGNECAIRTGDTNDVVMNRGGTVLGNIETAGGDDIVYFQGGVCDGDLDGGAGRDSLMMEASPGTTFSFTHAAIRFELAIMRGGGTVELDGQIAAAEIRIANGCRTQGVGQFNGNVWNAGVLAPGHSMGTLTVNGEFINTYVLEFSDDHSDVYKGILEIEADATQNDVLVVTGVATLQDGSEIHLIQAPGKPIPNGRRLTLLTAGGGITDEGAILVSNSPVLHFARVENQTEWTGHDLEVECTRDSYGSRSASANRAAVGRALTVGVDGATGDLADVLTELDSMESTADIDQALGQLTPDAFAAATTATLRGVSLFGSSFLDHLRRAPGVSVQGLGALNDSWTGPLLAESGAAVPVTPQAVAAAHPSSPASNPTWKGYASAYAATGDVEADDTTPGQNYSTGGTLFGLDRGAADGFRKGLVGGGSYSQSSLDNQAGSANVTSIRLGPSAAIIDGPWYAGTFLTYGHHQIETTRRIRLGALQRIAESESNAHDVSAFVGGGYDISLGAFTLTPEVSLQYTWIYEEGAAESGARSLDLDVDARRLQSLLGSAGLRLERPVDVKWGRIIPAAWVRQEHDQQWGDNHRRATLAGVPGTPFQTSWDTPAEDRTRLGLALASVSSARGISVEVRYEFTTGANLTEHLGALIVAVPF